jgi:hypothetical protein
LYSYHPWSVWNHHWWRQCTCVCTSVVPPITSVKLAMNWHFIRHPSKLTCMVTSPWNRLLVPCWLASSVTFEHTSTIKCYRHYQESYTSSSDLSVVCGPPAWWLSAFAKLMNVWQ